MIIIYFHNNNMLFFLLTKKRDHLRIIIGLNDANDTIICK